MTGNPYSENAEFWHVRVRDPGLFKDGSYYTISADKANPDRLKLVIGRLKSDNRSKIQKVLVLKAAMPDPKDAVAYVKGMREIGDRPNLHGNPPDRKFWIPTPGNDPALYEFVDTGPNGMTHPDYATRVIGESNEELLAGGWMRVMYYNEGLSIEFRGAKSEMVEYLKRLPVAYQFPKTLTVETRYPDWIGKPGEHPDLFFHGFEISEPGEDAVKLLKRMKLKAERRMRLQGEKLRVANPPDVARKRIHDFKFWLSPSGKVERWNIDEMGIPHHEEKSRNHEERYRRGYIAVTAVYFNKPDNALDYDVGWVIGFKYGVSHSAFKQIVERNIRKLAFLDQLESLSKLEVWNLDRNRFEVWTPEFDQLATDALLDFAGELSDDADWNKNPTAADPMFDEQTWDYAMRHEANELCREKIVEMRIDDFLSLSSKLSLDAPRFVPHGTAEDVARRGIRWEGLPGLDVVDWGRGNARVAGHEGRHRAVALKARGHTVMPVVISHRFIRWGASVDPAHRDYKPRFPAWLYAQVGAERPRFHIPFPVTREIAARRYEPDPRAWQRPNPVLPAKRYGWIAPNGTTHFWNPFDPTLDPDQIEGQDEDGVHYMHESYATQYLHAPSVTSLMQKGWIRVVGSKDSREVGYDLGINSILPKTELVAALKKGLPGDLRNPSRVWLDIVLDRFSFAKRGKKITSFRLDLRPGEDAISAIERWNPKGEWEQNPSGNPLGTNPADEELPQIYGKTTRIEMTRTRGRYKGQRFFHNFGKGVAQYGIPEGASLSLPSGRQVKLPRRTVLMAGPKGLWGHYS